MDNDETSPLRKTPELENEYQYSASRRSSTSLSLVGGSPADLHQMDVYDRVHESPVSLASVRTLYSRRSNTSIDCPPVECPSTTVSCRSTTRHSQTTTASCRSTTECRTTTCPTTTRCATTTRSATTTQCPPTSRCPSTTRCPPTTPCVSPVSVKSTQSSQSCACPLDICRGCTPKCTTAATATATSTTETPCKMCPLDICKMHAGLGKEEDAACSAIVSPKKVQFPPTKKTDDDCTGGVVRWTEKCPTRCRPTMCPSRWPPCDKPTPRCLECNPMPRCVQVQDYDSHRFAPTRKCDCCDKRHNPAPRPVFPNCGCDAFPRGIPHMRRPAMPQPPFDASCSAYFNRLNKPMFPRPPAPFDSMPQPFNTQFNAMPDRDSTMNVLQDPDTFASPLKACGTHYIPGQGYQQETDPSLNMVTNPHGYNATLISSNCNTSANLPINPHGGYSQKYPQDLVTMKDPNMQM